MLDKLPDNRVDYLKVMVKLSEYISELTKYQETFYYGSVLNGSIQNLFILVSRALLHRYRPDRRKRRSEPLQ